MLFPPTFEHLRVFLLIKHLRVRTSMVTTPNVICQAQPEPHEFRTCYVSHGQWMHTLFPERKRMLRCICGSAFEKQQGLPNAELVVKPGEHWIFH